MKGIVFMIIAIVVLGAGYIFYGGYLCKKWGIDTKKKTPAYEFEDGVDYVPTNTQVVFGHQFASIAGAGPISGPILAAAFGWLPVLLWILIGGVFFGAVQDFSAMYASVKNKGRTIGYIIEKYIGKTGKVLFLTFCWLFCILVIAAFADVVASTFMSNSANDAVNSANGSVATTSSLFIFEAVALGFFLKYSKFNKWVNTGVAFLMLVLGIVVGLNAPMLGISVGVWHIIVFIYILIASVVPMWALLQPRDYLNSYLLIIMIVSAVVGIFVANPDVNLNAFNGFYIEGMGSMFPILFVTIACGAVSGFHALVSSGTSSKQIKNEAFMRPVSYGSMLLESLLAIIALIVVASFVGGAAGAAADFGYTTPSLVFAGGVASFISTLGIPHSVVFTLINLAVSAFALTSLDSVARVGRLSFQELFLSSDIDENDMPAWRKFLTNKYFATIITLVFAYALAKAGYANIWPLFGSANQLLSALSLIACAVFFKKTNREGRMLWIPMFIMLAVTLTALILSMKTKALAIIAGTSLSVGGDILQLSFAIALFVLGIIVAVSGIKALLSKKQATSEIAE